MASPHAQALMPYNHEKQLETEKIYIWSDRQLLRNRDGQMIMNDISTGSILHNIYFVLEKSVSSWQNADCYSSESDVNCLHNKRF